MRHGVTLFATDRSIAPARLAREVEARGFDSLYLPEHTHIPVSRRTPAPTGEPELPEEYRRTLDPFVALAAAAAVTSRIRIGTGICLVAQRDPIVTAKAVATLDLLSEGRFAFGIGYGWNREEMESHGVDPKTRRARAREHLRVMERLWSDDEASFQGDFVRLEPSWSWPKPVQRPRPPVLIGGAPSPGLFEHIAADADGWIPIGGAGVAAALPDLHRAARAGGRDPALLEVVLFGVVPDREKLDRYAAIGATEVVFRLPSAPAEVVLPILDRYATFLRMSLDRPEISDLVIAYDPETLERLPVARDEVVAELERHAMAAAVRMVARWPHQAGVLDARFVDGVLLRAHHELQRLSEEFRQGERMRAIFVPLLEALRRSGVPGPYRIVDVGCGLGYVIRWLAAHGDLGDDTRLVGCDYNAPFVRFAARLAEEERLPCEFVVANAFRLDEPATIFTSTGVIHHFRREGLDRFLAEQGASGACAFVHCDTKPSYLAPLGSWIFHQARMREPLARHDGVLSALRAHPGGVLAAAARRTCPGFTVGLYDGERERVPILKVMHVLVGVRRDLAGAFVERLGPRAPRLGEFS